MISMGVANVDKKDGRSFAFALHNQRYVLTHWGRVHIRVGNLTTIFSDNAWSAPSHYLNQCWVLLIRPLEQTSVKF